MEVLPLEDFQTDPRGRHVALGYFDGLHRGHQRILRSARERAEREGGRSCVFTFKNHPASVLRPERAPLLLTPFPEKIPLLEAAGLDELVWREFDLPFSRMEPEAFVREVLLKRLGARSVSVGPNYRFGFQARGTPAQLTELGDEMGFEVDVVAAVDEGGRMISSTRIREHVSMGEVRQAAELLGREYGALARVTQGDRRGTQLGFPTANLACDPLKLLPADGVYAARVVLRTAEAQDSASPVPVFGVANLGVRPTFEGRRRVLEVHLLDFEGDLYGRELEMRFVERLREERRFPDVEALVAQIREDVAAARRVLGPSPPARSRA